MGFKSLDNPTVLNKPDKGLGVGLNWSRKLGKNPRPLDVGSSLDPNFNSLQLANKSGQGFGLLSGPVIKEDPSVRNNVGENLVR